MTSLLRTFRATLAVIAVLVAAIPVFACAQGAPAPVPDPFASLTGVVTDSIRGRPLAGALVTVVGTERQATTDANGRFRIDSLAPGTHSIVVTHPLLDTLGLKVRSAPFTLSAGERLEVGAQTPSLEDLREGSCPLGGVVYGPSILVGRVLKADSGEPAAGAEVSLVFKNVDVTGSAQRVRVGHADATGLFAICALPLRFAGNVQASFNGLATAELPVSLDGASVVATATLSIGTAASGAAVLSGKVTTNAGAPVSGAQVAVVGATPIAITADDGSFTLRGLPSGTHEAVVRKIGFAQTSQVLTLATSAPSTLRFVLSEAQTLTTVKIVGTLDGGLSKIGFNNRKRVGMGWFRTPDQIDAEHPVLTSDVLRSAAGLRVVNGATGTTIQSTRGVAGTSEGCVNVFIDHAPFAQTQPGDVDNVISTTDLGAVEYYPDAATTPAEFSVTGRGCATLVIWSKSLLSRQKP